MAAFTFCLDHHWIKNKLTHDLSYRKDCLSPLYNDLPRHFHGRFSGRCRRAKCPQALFHAISDDIDIKIVFPKWSRYWWMTWVRSDTNDAKIIWKMIWKSPRAFCFLIKNALWVQTMQKLPEILSETNRKTERKARLNLVCSTNSQIQPNTRTAQCARCLFMFLLAVLSHNQIYFQIKWMPSLFKKMKK